MGTKSIILIIREIVIMNTIFALVNEEIDNNVSEGRAGVYLLLCFDPKQNSWLVRYVGRSDTDLNARLKQHCSKKYDAFCFEYATTPLEAYYGECRYYHRYGGDRNLLDNEYHPDAPKGLAEKVVCPYCIEQ